MTNEQVVSVPDMLRVTGENTAEFMKQVADHIEKLEEAVVQLQARVTELEGSAR
jgi:ketopantoate hydroxymethyltransferase